MKCINHKNIYSRIKADYLRLNEYSHQNKQNQYYVQQKGGYITIDDVFIESLFRTFNVKLFLDITKTPIDNVQAYDDLAKLMMSNDKYQKYKSSANTANYTKAFNTLKGFKTQLETIYKKDSTTFDV